ncbi:MAG: hypothetical protein H0X29_05460, partial [Parachlamydiaceae bacterium]|nr:hypothetical protein [Parachlamydiaceae bacterium]
MQFSEHAIAFFSFLIIAAITSLIARSIGFYQLPGQKKEWAWNSSVNLSQVIGGFFILMTVE